MEENSMRLFSWRAVVGNKCIADGYLLAKNREEAEEKLRFVPFHDKHEEVELNTDDCGYDGCIVDENGVIIRWED